MIYLTYDLPPPTNITNMFGKWVNGVDKTDEARILTSKNTNWNISFVLVSLDKSELTDKRELIFSRLFDEQHTGFSNGLFCLRSISGRVWLLNATVC
jgi:hypothetical protein